MNDGEPNMASPNEEQQGLVQEVNGLDLAYDLIPATYDWMMQRLNAMESRIQALIVLSAGFLLTGPALVAVAVESVTFDSLWFYLALATSIVNLITGAAMRIWGELKLPGPRRVDSGWLSLNAGEFKWSSLWWAEQHFNENARLLRWKGRSAVLMTGVFLLETLSLTVWGMTQTG